MADPATRHLTPTKLPSTPRATCSVVGSLSIHCGSSQLPTAKNRIFRSSWGSITFGKGRVPRSRVLLSGL
ncbi:KLK6 isoform 6 [Pan troglodytes]|uniref:Kallikrein related peptidase 6 n=2 Tax=Homininae TaxID=207598 RepID=M0QYA5_HUMAN|nr:kallikrein related peptidase 6 [Homo sapiens]KAI4044256.1 kallikrein related peptidase 6 [Homo sapiens]PNI91885.1 KLK6 isoform 6 [Pan troglodytes]